MVWYMFCVSSPLTQRFPAGTFNADRVVYFFCCSIIDFFFRTSTVGFILYIRVAVLFRLR
jgi:hypothetical protein